MADTNTNPTTDKPVQDPTPSEPNQPNTAPPTSPANKKAEADRAREADKTQQVAIDNLSGADRLLLGMEKNPKVSPSARSNDVAKPEDSIQFAQSPTVGGKDTSLPMKGYHLAENGTLVRESDAPHGVFENQKTQQAAQMASYRQLVGLDVPAK